jgi:chromate transporter
MIDPVAYFLLSLKASLFSTGGQGNLPSLHQDLVVRGWASDQQFAQALAIGQLSPGPSGLWPIALGYLVAGVTGASLASIALVLPPLLVLPMARLHRRFAGSAAVQGFLRGLALAVAASVPVIILRVVGSYGYDLAAVLIAVGSFVLILSGRLAPVAVLGFAALVGAVVYR